MKRLNPAAARSAPKKAPTAKTQKPVPEFVSSGSTPTVTLNTQRDLVEIRFPTKPDDAVRAQLKSAKFRWYGPAGCWYHKNTPANLDFAHRLAGSGEAETAETQKSNSASPSEFMSSGSPAPKTARCALARRQLDALTPFIGATQRAYLKGMLRGEEWEFPCDLLQTLTDRIGAMPQTYDQDGLGEKAVAHLHYFAGGQANWWITEKDKGSPDDEEQGLVPGEQHQAFGLADLFGDGGELGYISIAEILARGGELDFHFTPQTIARIRGGGEAETAETQKTDSDSPSEFLSSGSAPSDLQPSAFSLQPSPVILPDPAPAPANVLPLPVPVLPLPAPRTARASAPAMPEWKRKLLRL